MIRIYLRPSGLHRHVATMLCLHVAASGFKSHAALPDNPTQAMAAHLTPLPVAPNVNWTDEVRTKLSSILSLMEMAEVEPAIGAENLLRNACCLRRDIGPRRRMAATSALSEAWREARAQGVFNRRDKPAEAEVLWSEASLTGSRSVRDLWAHKNLGEFNDKFSASVPPHGAVPLRVEAIL